MCRKLVTSGGHVRPVGPAPNSHDISNSLKMSEVLRCKCVAICCSSTRNINWPHLLPKAAWRTCELQDRHSLSRSELTCTCLSPAKATAIPSAMRTAAEPEKTLLKFLNTGTFTCKKHGSSWYLSHGKMRASARWKFRMHRIQSLPQSLQAHLMHTTALAGLVSSAWEESEASFCTSKT